MLAIIKWLKTKSGRPAGALPCLIPGRKFSNKAKFTNDEVFVVICYSLLVLSMRSLRGVLEPARFNFRRSAHVARKWLLLKEFSSLIMQNLSSRGCMRPAGKVKESCREKGFRWAEILLKLFLTKE